MALTNTSLAPIPKDRSDTVTDPVKEATDARGAAAAGGRSTAGQSAPANGDVAVRAYEHWRGRGCPDGSPEVDWRRAEDELRLSKHL